MEELARVSQKMDSLYFESEGDRRNTMYSEMDPKKSVDMRQSLGWERGKCRECANRRNMCEGSIIPPFVDPISAKHRGCA